MTVRDGNVFPRALRIRSGADFRIVFQQRTSVADQSLIVYGMGNGLEFSRLGLSVSRKVGNAVARNKWKRLIREAFRTQRSQIPAGVDFVVIPRKGAKPAAAAVAPSLLDLACRVVRKIEIGGGRRGHGGKAES